MSKIFRLYTGGNDTYKDWNSAVTFPYDANARKTISDPAGAAAKNEITSIPSPFARIDLVKMAFAEVYRSGNLDGNTIFHKMVSDTLDVGEIFFNYNKFSDKIEIIVWDCKTEIQALLDSASQGHRYYGDALDKYLHSDGATYNFDKLKNVYLLNYKNGPAPLNIIGATSPATLFFSTANDLSYVNDIFFAHDKPFDDEYQPLYKRADKEYIKCWFLLRNTISGFAQLFPEVDDYLELTYKAIADENLKQELRNMSTTNSKGFGDITITTATLTNTVEVLGHGLYQKKTEVSTSGFEIISTIFSGQKKPFALPVEAGNKYADIDYTTGKWGNSNHAPFFDANSNIYTRTLPFDGNKHPYLTISDFLEDNIVKVPHTLNKEAYFDGNANLLSDNQLSYLLPLKKTFFEYFTTEELTNGFASGEKMMEMQSLAGDSIKVTLRIPVKGDGRNVSYIEYSRIYYGGNNHADINNNRGGIITFDFAGFVMPGIKFNMPTEAFYTIGCVMGFSSKYDMTFFNKGGKLDNVTCDCRNIGDSKHLKANSYTIEKELIDYIQVTNRQGYSGIIVPIFKPQVSNDNISFAVDLGTSNTHIEYIRNGSGEPHEFDVSEDKCLICKLFLPSYQKGTTTYADLDEEQALIDKDFLPSSVGNGSDFSFPTRTVLSYASHIDWQLATKPFGLVNIPLTYNKREPLNHNKTATDIKWGKNDKNKIEAYIDCLMVLLRNKVVTEGGIIGNTKLTWFYPISMAPRRLNMLKDTWNRAFTKYFGINATNSITESEAPIQYYFQRYANATNLVNIDIGGGTTDIAFAKDKKIEYVTSFKFASNALFEDSLADGNTHNGIIDYYKSKFKEILEGQNLNELTSIFEKNEDRPSDMAMFLFSLSRNTLAGKLNKDEIDFTAKLREDDDFKIVFILFYAAIIWHVAQIVRLKGLKEPRHITFSGNGSKVLSVITTNSNDLASMTKKIFELVLGHPYDTDGLDILGLSEKDTNPKMSTCKGGLKAGSASGVGREKIIILKSDASGVVTNDDTYDKLDDEYLKEAATGVDTFFDAILNKLNAEFDLDDYFGVASDSLTMAKDVCKKDINTYIKKGRALLIDESDGNARIDETLFFYPIKGVLQALSLEIQQTKINN